MSHNLLAGALLSVILDALVVDVGQKLVAEKFFKLRDVRSILSLLKSTSGRCPFSESICATNRASARRSSVGTNEISKSVRISLP